MLKWIAQMKSSLKDCKMWKLIFGADFGFGKKSLSFPATQLNELIFSNINKTFPSCTTNSAIHKATGQAFSRLDDPEGPFQPPAPPTAHGSFRNRTR